MLPAHLKETGEILDFGLSLGNKISLSMSDGKFDFTDAPYFIEPIMKLPNALEDAAASVKELSAMSPADKKLLVDFIRQKFDLADDEIEKRIEDALAFGLGVVSYLKTWL